MTRRQKAAAAFGSGIAVGLYLVVAWSFWGGVAVLVLGVALTVLALRLTHPSVPMRPSIAGEPLRSVPSGPPVARISPDPEPHLQRTEPERDRLAEQQQVIERAAHTDRTGRAEMLDQVRRRLTDYE
jgi:hypothetical protein